MATFEQLFEIMDTLMGPEGCPWDREQTLETLRSSVLEETCELIDAINTGDGFQIAEELGASSAYISKIHTQLVKANVLVSHRGKHGGVTLARNPRAITLFEVVEACQGHILSEYEATAPKRPSTGPSDARCRAAPRARCSSRTMEAWRSPPPRPCSPWRRAARDAFCSFTSMLV